MKDLIRCYDMEGSFIFLPRTICFLVKVISFLREHPGCNFDNSLEYLFGEIDRHGHGYHLRRLVSDFSGDVNVKCSNLERFAEVWSRLKEHDVNTWEKLEMLLTGMIRKQVDGKCIADDARKIIINNFGTGWEILIYNLTHGRIRMEEL